MTKWDYSAFLFTREKLEGAIRAINDLGKQGWELVSVDNGIAYFKRPIEKGKKDVSK